MIDDFPNLTSVTTLCFPVSSKVKKNYGVRIYYAYSNGIKSSQTCY